MLYLLFQSDNFNSIPDWQLFILNSLHNCNYPLRILTITSQRFNSEEFNPIKRFQYWLEKLANHQVFDRNKVRDLFLSLKGDYIVSKNNLLINLPGLDYVSIQLLYGDVKVWNFIYDGKYVGKLFHLGEYELVNKKDTINILLQEQSSLSSVHSIDIARHNLHYSGVRNFQNVTYSLHLLILRQLRNNKRKLDNNISNVYYRSCFYSYLFAFWKTFTVQIFSKLLNRFCNYYPERWTVALSQGSFLKRGVSELKIIKEPKGEFWADPFLYRDTHTDKIYLFFERFPYKEKKGVLSCGLINDDLKITELKDILVRPYHFSYPHIISEHGELFMLPESSANLQLELYKCVKFPYEWKLETTMLEGHSVTDTVYYKDKDGNCWLFTTESDSTVIMHCTIMNIYLIDKLNATKVIPHKLNPIYIDSTKARNGGRIYEEDGKIYRVAQNNSYGCYGYGISVREITKLTLDNYEEKEVRNLVGTNIKGAIGTHHMCQIDDMFVMDIRLS